MTREYYGGEVNGPRLRQLIRLAETAETGAPVVFETRRGDTTLTGRSLDHLLGVVRESTEPGDPDDIDNIGMRSTGPIRQFNLVVRAAAMTWTVRGDTRWARGVTEEIHGLLTTGCGGRPAQSSGGLLHALVATPFAGALAGVAFATGLLPWSGWGLASAAIFVVLGGLAGFLIGRFRRRRDRCRVSVAELPPRRWWSGIETRDRIATVALIVAFLTLVANSVKVFSP